MPQFSLRLYSVSLETMKKVRPVVEEIGRHDQDLARQLRRALTSIHLNLSEGMDSEGRIRHSRYRTALGSTNECIAALDAGCALGYLATIPEDAADGLQHVRATLLKLVMRK